MTTELPKKIVVAIDGSEPSFRAAEYATQLANLTKSALVALHVILLPSYASPSTLEALSTEFTTKAEGFFARVRKLAESSGVDIETEAVETDRSVVKAIVDYAEQVQADLVVVGTRGTAGMPKLMLGSVAAGVVSFAHCSVLAVR